MGAMTPRMKQGIMAMTANEKGEFYYNGQLDGIWGPESQAASERFLRDFTGEVAADNNVGDKSFWDEIEFFDREEFRCQCGGKYCNGFPVEPEEKMVRIVNEIRRRLGVPVEIVTAGGSGIRCEKHNASIKGAAANSEHKYGRAADLHSSASPARMKQVAEEVMGKTGGIGLYSWGIHVDTGKYSRWNG